jgi:hypothetical protein
MAVLEHCHRLHGIQPELALFHSATLGYRHASSPETYYRLVPMHPTGKKMPPQG